MHDITTCANGIVFLWTGPADSNDPEIPRDIHMSQSPRLYGADDDLHSLEVKPHRNSSPLGTYLQETSADPTSGKLMVDTHLAQRAPILPDPSLETPLYDESQAAMFNRSPETVVKKPPKAPENKKAKARPKTAVSRPRQHSTKQEPSVVDKPRQTHKTGISSSRASSSTSTGLTCKILYINCEHRSILN